MTTNTISAIISHEDELESLVEDLIKTTAARHQISVQGSADKMNKVFGTPYVDPTNIQHEKGAPQTEPFLKDDFGWILGYSFSIPLVIGIVLGVFVIGDIHSLSDNLLYGSLGGFLGGILGAICAMLIKKRWDDAIKKQEHLGGFVIWVQLTEKDNVDDIYKVLNKHHASHIETSSAA
jgi:hypothetical protein